MKDVAGHIYDDFIVQTVVTAFNTISTAFEKKYKKKIQWEMPDDPLRDNYLISLTMRPVFDDQPDSIFGYIMIIKKTSSGVTLETMYSYDTRHDGLHKAHGQFAGKVVDVETIEPDDIVEDIKNGWNMSQSKD